MMDDFRDDFIRDELVGDEAEAGQGAEILPFKTFNAAAWEGVPIEPRRWIVRNRIPQGEPGIMSGDGGTGKTKLALQLAVAIPAGLPDWIGGIVDAEGPAIVFSAEEKLTEMHRRTADVLEHRGLSFKNLHGGLHFVCDEEAVVLGAIDRRGIVQPSMALLRLEKTIAAIKPAFVMIENAADVYGGNENDRTNVTRFVRHILGRLTSACNSTIMLIQHPSVSGLNDGTGRSGSTGWNNSGRWRNNFTKLKDDDDKLLRLFEVVKTITAPTMRRSGSGGSAACSSRRAPARPPSAPQQKGPQILPISPASTWRPPRASTSFQAPARAMRPASLPPCRRPAPPASSSPDCSPRRSACSAPT
jgi:hypothetical protein